MIVSVDCGITAVGPAQAAKDAGVDLIITDHHDLRPDDLPDAVALVHPRLPGSHTPSHLCGAGVAFKLAWQFAKMHCGSDRLPEAFRSLLIDLLTYVALGTVADVVPLIDENRGLVTHGLSRINDTRFAGLSALIDASRLVGERIESYHVGFVLAPRINCVWSHGHAAQALSLLTDATPIKHDRSLSFLPKKTTAAGQPRGRSSSRPGRWLSHSGYDQDDCRAIVLGKEGWHPGVLGLSPADFVTSSLAPWSCCRTTMTWPKGSARSVRAVSIRKSLTSAHLC